MSDRQIILAVASAGIVLDCLADHCRASGRTSAARGFHAATLICLAALFVLGLIANR